MSQALSSKALLPSPTQRGDPATSTTSSVMKFAQLTPISTIPLDDCLGFLASVLELLDVEIEGLDSEVDDSLHTSPDSDIVHPCSLSPLEGSQVYLELVTYVATALIIQFISDTSAIMDLVDKLVPSDLPPASLLPSLPVHLKAHHEAWDKPGSIPPASKCFDSLYQVQPLDLKFLLPSSEFCHSGNWTP
ncbi:UNVERIFIED_CONTAM: hypothetical protein K2H54_008186 [Gekko kuhli]